MFLIALLSVALPALAGDAGRPPPYEPGKGLYAKAPDGTASLRVNGVFQVQGGFERDPALADPTLDISVRRARMYLSGHARDGLTRYKLQFGFGPGTVKLKNGVATHSLVQDAYLDFTRVRDANVRVGQFKVPYDLEQLMSGTKQTFVDRSAANGAFAQERDLGVALHSKSLFGVDKLRYMAGVFEGEGRDPASGGDLALAYLGRVELLPTGPFQDKSGADLTGGAPRVALGLAGGHIQHAHKTEGIGGDTPLDGGTTDMTVATADLLFKAAGVSVMAAGHMRSGTRNVGEAVDELGNPIAMEPAHDANGYLAQAGYVLPSTPVELALRYAGIRPASDTSPTPELNTVTAGLNWYLSKHDVKLQLDHTRSWGESGYEDAVGLTRALTQLAF